MVTTLLTVVPLQGTLDIAYARNTLRQKIAQQRWSMLVNLHASIALTALGELILLADHEQPVMVTIEALTEPGQAGIKLSTRFEVPSRRSMQWGAKLSNLQQAAHEFELIEIEGGVEIAAYIWVE